MMELTEIGEQVYAAEELKQKRIRKVRSDKRQKWQDISKLNFSSLLSFSYVY